MPDLDLDDLPVLPVPVGDPLEQQAQLHRMLCLWTDAGQGDMFSFKNLSESTKMGGAVAHFVRDAMGAPWRKWFPTDPEPDSIIPCQLAALLTRSLGRLKEHWQAQQQADEVRASATASYAVLVGQAKKRRADFDEACMGMGA